MPTAGSAGRPSGTPSYMKRHHCFSHSAPARASFVARLERVHYIVDGLRALELWREHRLGRRQRGTPKAIVRSWMHSPPHRANILNPQFRHLGVGFARGCPERQAAATAASYTTDFGMRRR